jgi:PAT family beta-lactamase induction signal transducer AmpG
VGEGVTTPQRTPGGSGRLLLLGMLYLVQGLPFGFQVSALPIFLREQGVGLAAIGYSTALAAPWALKILWAPLVERYGGRRGRRIRWIVPLQLLMVVGFVLASTLQVPDQLEALMAVLLLLNALAATQDIAVDGLAVDILPPSELGVGNAAQVVGYKVGMLMAGGVLVWASAWLGWSGAFLVMAAVVLAVAVGVSRVREVADEAASEAHPTENLSTLLKTLRQSFHTRGIGVALAVVATYKMGESIIDVMYKPFLIDQGISASTLGLWLGTWGMGASVLGSVLGGLLAARQPLFRMLIVVGALRLLPELGQLALAAGWLSVADLHVIGISLAEHLVGGALTTVMFATMMGMVDRRIGATHFTLFACVEVWGKSASALVSGVIAETFSYAGAFSLGIVIGVAFLWLVTRLPNQLEPNRAVSG